MLPEQLFFLLIAALFALQSSAFSFILNYLRRQRLQRRKLQVGTLDELLIAKKELQDVRAELDKIPLPPVPWDPNAKIWIDALERFKRIEAQLNETLEILRAERDRRIEAEKRADAADQRAAAAARTADAAASAGFALGVLGILIGILGTWIAADPTLWSLLGFGR